jgi:predicted transcriptional regulator
MLSDRLWFKHDKVVRRHNTFGVWKKLEVGWKKFQITRKDVQRYRERYENSEIDCKSGRKRRPARSSIVERIYVLPQVVVRDEDRGGTHLKQYERIWNRYVETEPDWK